jgi:asparagine synthase (glutamine-hydrolysing)
MCGIVGLYTTGTPLVLEPTQRAIRSMADSIRHRGPDAEGAWIDPQGRCGLGHRRLSIIDTSDAGRQPMISADGRWVISFNGEIYNYRELRKELVAEGSVIQGLTDTEVLLEGIVRHGVDFVRRLDGMFAFAAFDTLSGDLLLARDAFGEKPLYYTRLSDGRIAFASELQALETLDGFDPQVDVDAIAEVLSFQYIGAPRTIYRSVAKLSPGHWMRLGRERSEQVHRWFRFSPGRGGFDARPLSELADELEDLLVRSLERRLIADVPLGAFLSGGVDSSTVCALVRRRLGRGLETFSIGFAGAAETEHETARRFASHLGTIHRDQILEADPTAFLRHIGQVLDEPNADSSCYPTWLLSKFTRQHVTVAISGDGGDELFGGYGRYLATLAEEPDRAKLGPPGARYYGNRILVSTESHIRELMGFVPQGYADHLSQLRAWIDTGPGTLLQRMRGSDGMHYMPGAVLPKVDRMSMQHALEVRTPFLNSELARFAERLPDAVLVGAGGGKRVLKEVAYRYLPRELIDLPKQGFGLPVSRWGREPLLALAGDMLGSESRLRAAFGDSGIDQFLTRQKGQGYATYQVWSALMLESWLRHHPAQVPDMSQERAPRARVRKATAVVAMCPIASGVWALFEDSDTFEQNGVNDPIRWVLARAQSHGHLAKPSLVAAGGLVEPIGLDESELPRRPIDADARRQLKGAILLIPDREFGKRLNGPRLAAWRNLGLNALVMPHPWNYDGTDTIIRFGRPSLLDRLKRARWVARHGIEQGTLDQALPGAGHSLESARLGSSIPVVSSELSGQFLLFEGDRQLPPLHVSHERIAAEGGGLYSIWEGRCIFSPLADGQAGLVRRRLVKRDPALDPLLDYLPQLAPPSGQSQAGGDIDQFVQAVAQRARLWQGSGKPLQTGQRVIVLTHALPAGGAERQWCHLARGLQARGLHVDFVCTHALTGADAHYLPLLKQSSIPLVSLEEVSLTESLVALRMLSDQDRQLISHASNPFGDRLLRLVAVLHHIRPSAVFAQLDSSNLLAGVASMLAGVPKVVLSFRNYNPSRFSYLDVPWFKAMYHALTQGKPVTLSGNSSAGNDDYAQWIGVDPQSIALIPNAIDFEPFDQIDRSQVRASTRHDLGANTATPVMLGVFRMSEEKRPLLFLEIVAAVRRRCPDVQAWMAGSGPMEWAVNDRIAELGLGDCVKLLGRRSDIPALMAAADLLLLTSAFEGMPNVVVEAHAAGLPVVASDVGGVADVVVDGHTGYVVVADEPSPFADACVRLLTDPALRQSQGLHAADRARAQFSIEAMATQYSQLFGRSSIAVERQP